MLLATWQAGPSALLITSQTPTAAEASTATIQTQPRARDATHSLRALVIDTIASPPPVPHAAASFSSSSAAHLRWGLGRGPEVGHERRHRGLHQGSSVHASCSRS